MIQRWIAKTYFRLTGWDINMDYDLHPQQVLVGFPHTTNLDGLRAVMLFKAMGLRASPMIKQELFVWPLSWLMKWIEAIPVDRSKRANLVEHIAERFRQDKSFSLAIAPEATRSKFVKESKKIKTGFWHIAKAANVPIVLMKSDQKNRLGGFIGEVHCSDDMEQDLQKIQLIYESHGIHIPVN